MDFEFKDSCQKNKGAIKTTDKDNRKYEVLTYGSWLVASFFLGNWSLTGLFNKWEDNLPGNTDEKQPNQKEPA